LEIGTGCGIIALECARIGAKVICSDINSLATALVKRNYQRNKSLIKGHIEVRLGDLFKVVKNNEKFDVIIFNPPYLPTKRSDYTGGSGWFDVATDGGVDGLSLTKKFIEELKAFLKRQGKAYFIFSSLSDRKKLENILLKSNYRYKIVKSQKFLDETIEVYQINYKKKIMKE
jgi:release factor glutamine methyltransferase